MPYIHEYKDGFDQESNPTTISKVNGNSINECLDNRFKDFEEFYNTPAIVIINDEAVLREDWGKPIEISTVIEIRYLPSIFIAPATIASTFLVSGVAATAISVAIFAASLTAMYALIPKPKSPDIIPSPDPLYTLSGQQNDIRPMQPIEVAYGRNIIFPSYVARPYVFWNTELIKDTRPSGEIDPETQLPIYEEYTRDIVVTQSLYQLFCLGQGEYVIHGIYIEDTLIQFFGKNYVVNENGYVEDTTNADIKIDIIRPNTNYPIKNFVSNSDEVIVTDSPPILNFFNLNVHTITEIGDVELLNQDQLEFRVIGPYIAVPSGEKTKFFAFDIAYPKGFVSQGGGEVEITSEFEIQEIDDYDYPLGDWFKVYTEVNQGQNYPSQIKYTRYIELPRPIRFQIRARRTDDGWIPNDQGNMVVLSALRVWLWKDQEFINFGDITLASVFIKANIEINDNTRTKINFDCTRVPDPYRIKKFELGGPGTESRSICAAFVDVISADYGGGFTDTDIDQFGRETYRYIDLPTLQSLDYELLASGFYFDFVFKQNITVWEALTTIARAGRCVPIIRGNKISMVRDSPKTFPVAIFNMDNIKKGTFKWEVTKPSIKDFDSVQVSYCNFYTGLEETITAYTEGEGLNPDKIDLLSISNKEIAYREALYVYQQNKYIREKISFTTGLEGLIPTYGDLVTVSYPIFTVCLGGWIESELESEVENVRRFILSEPYDWEEEGNEAIIFIRDDSGESRGPYKAMRPIDILDEDEQKYRADIEIYDPLEFSNEAGREKIFYQIGKYYDNFKKCKLISSKPSGDEDVEIECVNYDDRIYLYDNATVPFNGGVPIMPEIPKQTRHLILSKYDNYYALFKWDSVDNANNYEWEIYRGDELIDSGETTDTFLRLKFDPSTDEIKFSLTSVRDEFKSEPRFWIGYIYDRFYAPRIEKYELTLNGIEIYFYNSLYCDKYWFVYNDWREAKDDTNLGIFSDHDHMIFTKQFKNNTIKYYPDLGFARIGVFHLYAVKDGNPVIFSEDVSRVTISIPAPLAPVFTSPNYEVIGVEEEYRTYILRWLPSVGTTADIGYRVYVSTDPSVEINKQNVVYGGTQTSITYYAKFDEGTKHHPTLYWRVVAADGWSDEGLNATGVAQLPEYNG